MKLLGFFFVCKGLKNMKNATVLIAARKKFSSSVNQ